MTKRMNINLTDSIHSALETESAHQGITMAAIVRRALMLYLERYGYDVSDRVTWGGLRDAPFQEDDEAPHG